MKIGLEVHVQLATKTKLFCSCPNKFSPDPNTHICVICTGMPGSKPRLNSKSVEFATKIALALNCSFPEKSMFSRKAYFYPDMSKNFQITQYEIPFAHKGHLMIANKKIDISRINLEEDPARIVHVGSVTQSKYVLVDYNRSGVPLCEIVTEPDFTDTKEVRAFLSELSGILEYLNVFDPESEGSIRVDANISMGSERVEVKNISGFREVEKALTYESVRQKSLVQRGKGVDRETRSWDDVAGVTRLMRKKEEEDDYGYITETDLTKLSLEKNFISEIKNNLPELAKDKIIKYTKMGINKDIAISIASDPEIAKVFEETIEKVDKELASRWFSGVIKKTLNFHNKRLSQTSIKKEDIVNLLLMLDKKDVTERTAENLFREMMIGSPDEILKSQDVARIHDEEYLSKLIDEALRENPKAILDYKNGRFESFNFIVGQVMRKTKGRGDPEAIREILKKRL